MSAGDGRPGGGTASGADRRRELVERYLHGTIPTATAATPIRRAPRDRPPPLSFAQQRLWFLDRLRPGGTEYVARWIWRMTGPLDPEALRASWTEVVRRHEVLRTRYQARDGEACQVIDPPGPVDLPLTDLSALPPDARDRRVAELTARQLDRPFDLERDAPLRLHLLRLGDETHLLVFTVHHIALDGWSAGVLARELSRFNTGFATGRPAALPPPAVQYADFAVWQRRWADGDAFARQLAHWRRRLAGLTPLEPPTDRPRPPVRDPAGATVSFTVPAPLAAALRAVGRTRKATPFMVLLAAFQVLLARHAGQDDVAVGTPIAGRTKPDVRETLGFFVNTLVMRADLSGDPAFTTFLDQVRATALEAYANQDLPFERLVTELAPERDLSRTPLVSHLFTLQDNATAGFAGAGMRAEPLPVPVTTVKFDLDLQLRERPDGGFDGVAEYATSLFDHETVRSLTGHYVRLLHAIAETPDRPVRRLPLLSADDRHRLIERWNDSDRAFPDVTVPELVERQVRRTPGAVAVRSGEAKLTYAELDAGANRLAHHLRALGAGPGTLVGVGLRRGTCLVTALLAVLKSGAAYVPVDPDHPAERIGLLLADAGAELIVTDGSLPIGAYGAAARTVDLGRDRGRIAARPSTAPERTAAPGDVAYLIYTSGSTGTPKGVVVPHRALANFLLSMAERPGLTAADTLVALTTVAFDISALELFLPLVTGARVVVAGGAEARDPRRLAELLAAEDATVLQATPATWRMLTESVGPPAAGLTVLCGGERLAPDLGERLVAGGADVWDLYGPTEATVWATTAKLDPTGRAVGWAPVANTAVHVLDDLLEPVPEGVVGELYLGGTAVAHGYHRRPALTAERFVPDPYGEPGGRLYRTGDLAWRRRDGAVEIVGRTDHQVKVRGFRIEPGEIEARLLALGEVTEAVVAVREDVPGDRRLVAYLVAGRERPAAELRSLLERTLPGYMVPAAFVYLPALPLTAGGKVDRKALPEPDATPPGLAARYVAPRDEAEELLCGLFAEVLGVARVGAEDDFFGLGGHSLLAVRVTARLREARGLDVPVRAVFDHTTPAALARALDGYPAAEIPALRRRAGRRAMTAVQTTDRGGIR
jgi:amino acid adenylation domain-containing protein